MRKNAKEILSRYAANFYKDHEKTTARPVNLVMRNIQVLAAFLVAQNPKAMVTTRKPEYKPFAVTTTEMINERIRAMRLYKTIRQATYNSFWYMGVIKTILAKTGTTLYEGMEIPIGDGIATSIGYENLVFDINARHTDPDEIEYLGDKYLIRMEDLKDSGNYKNYDKVTSACKLFGEESPNKIAKDNASDDDFRELHDYAIVYDVWLPERGIIATLPQLGQGTKYMRTVEWDGPETGPYDLLAYNWFPDTIIPIPPIYSILDMEEQFNKMARKMLRQAGREKKVLAYESTAADDAQRVVSSTDGETVKVENIDRLKEVSFGGINSDMFPIIQWMRTNISEQAGNLDLLGGLNNASPTLGQDQLLHANATKVLDDMVWAVHHFSGDVIKKLAWFDWTDPLINKQVTKRVGNIEIPAEFSQASKQGDFFDYVFEVMPYSMQRMTPEVRMQKVMQWIGQVVLPTLELGVQQGNQLNVRELAQRTADYMDIDVKELYMSSVPTSSDVGAYQPMMNAKPVSGQGSDRFGSNGANKQANMNSQQSRSGGMSSKTMGEMK